MDKPNLLLSNFNPLIIQNYTRYLPTAFDEGMTLLEKVNKIIVSLNQMGKLSNDVFDQWNQVMEWVTSDGLDSSVNDKINAMVTDGTLATVINETLFNDLSDRLTTDEANWNSIGTNFGNITDLKQPNGTTITSKIQDEFADRGTSITWYKDLVTDPDDWSPAFQQAINDVNAVGGGTVWIPAGTFKIKNKITMKRWVRLQGVNNAVSVVQCADGTTLDYMFDNEIIYQNYSSGIQYKDFAISGNRSKSSTGGIIAYNTWQGEFRNLRMYDIHGDALVIYGKSTDPTYGASTNWIKDCWINYNDGYGIRVDVDKDSNGNATALNGDVHITGCDIGMNGNAGIYIGFASANTIRDTVTWMNGQNKNEANMFGILLDHGADLTEITGCNIEGTQGHGIYIKSSYTTVEGCRIFNNSEKQGYSYYGIYIYDGTGANILGNKWNGQQQGIYNNGTYTNIRNNDFRWNNGAFSPDLDYDFVVSSTVAAVSLNCDYAHVLTNLSYQAGANNITLGFGSNNLVFTSSLGDSWSEYSATDGYFRPKMSGYYVFNATLYVQTPVLDNMTLSVNGINYFEGNIQSPSGGWQSIHIQTPPIWINKNVGVNVVLACGQANNLLQGSSILTITKRGI